MRDVLQHAIDGDFGWIVGEVQHAGSFADGLAELKPIGNFFTCGVNQ